MNSVPRALRASVRSTELSKNGKCGKTLNTQWTRFCEAILREGGFAKTRLIFKKLFGLGFRPAGGCGRNAGRIFFAGGQLKNRQ